MLSTFYAVGTSLGDSPSISPTPRRRSPAALAASRSCSTWTSPPLPAPAMGIAVAPPARGRGYQTLPRVVPLQLCAECGFFRLCLRGGRRCPGHVLRR
jgi:hypothetical protein